LVTNRLSRDGGGTDRVRGWETETLTILPEKLPTASLATRIFRSSKPRSPERCSAARRLKRGSYLEAQNGSQGEVIHVDEEVVRVDFNPRLAGETLTFDVEIIDVN